jgi:hypothetical protein
MCSSSLTSKRQRSQKRTQSSLEGSLQPFRTRLFEQVGGVVNAEKRLPNLSHNLTYGL